MLPVEEAFVIHAFIDPKNHLWLLGHSSKDAIKQELFRVVILIAEIQYVACLLALCVMMHRLVNGLGLH
jgi:hypothetical protein